MKPRTKAGMLVLAQSVTIVGLLSIYIGDTPTTTYGGFGMIAAGFLATLVFIQFAKRELARKGQKVSRNPFKI